MTFGEPVMGWVRSFSLFAGLLVLEWGLLGFGSLLVFGSIAGLLGTEPLVVEAWALLELVEVLLDEDLGLVAVSGFRLVLEGLPCREVWELEPLILAIWSMLEFVMLLRLLVLIDGLCWVKSFALLIPLLDVEELLVLLWDLGPGSSVFLPIVGVGCRSVTSMEGWTVWLVVD